MNRNELAVTAVGVVFVACIVFFSLDFQKPYAPWIRRAAHNPIARLAAGLILLALGYVEPALAVLWLIIVFFWVADVTLLSRKSF
jgi:hypothetical protein